MKNKAPLSLMEQLLMVLVFALAAALCLQGFVLANHISERSELKSHAVLMAQNTAELLKHTSGDFETAAEELNGTWNGEILSARTSQSPSLYLNAVPADTDNPLLGAACIQVFHEEDCLFEITVAWQKEVSDYAE